MRAGAYVRQSTDYRAFIPRPLPPDPPLEMGGEMIRALDKAVLALGRLDGVSMILPNPDLFVGMYVRQEAVLSSQIEGTQASLTDVLLFEVGEEEGLQVVDVEEVVNYVGALHYGLARLDEFPLSLRLIREIHGRLLQGVRGQDKDPGEFRTSQNWVGPAGSGLQNATYVPPPPPEMKSALGDLEEFLHDDSIVPLVHAALAHAQFETIHPFLDGNGRIGRLLVAFLLCHRKVLRQPLLYLSHYLKRHRAEYYDRLQAVRESGDWEGWVRFFLTGVAEVAAEAELTARRILALRENDRARLSGAGKAGANLLRLHELLFEKPIVNVRTVENRLEVTYATANSLVERLTKLGMLFEMTGYQRNRRFAYAPYLRLFHESEAASFDADLPEQATGGEPEEAP